MVMYDGKKKISLIMMSADGHYIDWSADCFDAGLLEYREDLCAHIVDDVDGYIEAAENWKFARGEFTEDEDFLKSVIENDGVEIDTDDLDEMARYLCEKQDRQVFVEDLAE